MKKNILEYPNNNSVKEDIFQDHLSKSMENTFKRTNPRLSHFDEQTQISHSRNKSNNKQLYIVKLQSRILQLQQTIETQKTEIKILNEQKKCLKKICEKQQNKILLISDVSNVREQYNKQIQQLKKEREKIMEILNITTVEHQKQLNQQRQQLLKVRQSNNYLQKTIRQFMKQQTQLKLQIENLTNELEKSSNELITLKEQLYQKRNIEKKYRLAVQQIERLQANQPNQLDI